VITQLQLINIIIIIIIQRFQNKILSNIVDAPWYIKNPGLHRDLQGEMVKNKTELCAKNHEGRLLHHVNFEAIQLLDDTEPMRRLKSKKPFELV
jgi:hypothetical protein